MKLDQVIRPKQKELFGIIRSMYRGCLARKGEFILVRGEAPIMLVAHMDTVHKKPVKVICKSDDGDVWMSPQGIGGDDRCGVYALMQVYERSQIKPWLLFTCDEEIGGKGADKFALRYGKGELPKEIGELKFLVEIDRKGSKDAVFYDCANEEFEAYVETKGFETDWGSFSDISYIAPAIGVAAVNLSSGYHSAHTQHEYIVLSELENTIQKVVEMVRDAAFADTPTYAYVEAKKRLWSLWDGKGLEDWHGYSYDGKETKVLHNEKGNVEDMLPMDLKRKYYEILDSGYQTHSDLEYLVEAFGDDIIDELYDEMLYMEDGYEEEQ